MAPTVRGVVWCCRYLRWQRGGMDPAAEDPLMWAAKASSLMVAHTERGMRAMHGKARVARMQVATRQ